MRGSLTVAGLGIQFAGHLTLAAKGCIEHADAVRFYAADPATGEWLRALNPVAAPLMDVQECAGERSEAFYERMAARMIAPARQGLRTCVALYGHPCVFAYPTRRAIEQGRKEGIPTRVVPGISALDCLFADLGIDPAQDGCQIFDATDLVVHERRFDVSSTLVLLQPTTVGHPYAGENRPGIAVLSEYLQQFYSPAHRAIVYEAPVYPVCEPFVERRRLNELAERDLPVMCLLCVPPATPPRAAHVSWLARLARSRTLST